jgi:hypothetical protein
LDGLELARLLAERRPGLPIFLATNRPRQGLSVPPYVRQVLKKDTEEAARVLAAVLMHETETL